MKRLLILLFVVLLSSCNYEEKTREIGHKGKARINPYLAAQRFLEELGFEIEKAAGWPDLEGGVSTVFIPASVLTAKGYVNALDRWASNGGHVVVVLNRGEVYLNDWAEGASFSFGTDRKLPEAFADWMNELKVEISVDAGVDGDPLSVEKVEFLNEEYEVFMEAKVCPNNGEDGDVMIRSFEYGAGRFTLIADARPFRNRWIGDFDHAALLLALENASPSEGSTVFVRKLSLSFWGLLWRRAWPVLVALTVLVLFWLWKSLPRFGPLDSYEATTKSRGYDHHLEALGDFHWRLDRAEGLLRPLREVLIERAHRLALASGHRDVDVFQLMAERSGMTRDRAERAMTVDHAKDAGTFTRLVADLQSIHLSIP